MIRAAAKNHADVAVVVDAERLSRALLAELDGARRRDHAGAAAEARRQGLCAHRGLRRGDLQLVRAAAGDDPAPDYRAFGGQLGRAAALRREPAPVGGVLSHAGAARRRRHARGSCRASSSPTTTSTTPTRPTNASPSSIPRAPPPASSSSTPIRAASPKARACSRPIARRCACDPVSAFGGIVALNRTLDAEAARAITEIFTEVIIAPDASEEAIAIVAREEEPAPAAGRRRCPIRAPPASRSNRSPAGSWCSRATTRWSTTCTLKTVTRRAPTNAELDRSARSRSGSPST